VHGNPRPSEQEHEQAATDRLREEDAIRREGHDDPDEQLADGDDQ